MKTKKTKLEYPEWMTTYPIEFWEDDKVKEYVKLAHEYIKTMNQGKHK